MIRAVPEDDKSTPRRTIRIPDAEWEAALQAAEARGETLSAVIRRRVADYCGGGPAVEYRAVSRTIPGLAVDALTGDLEDIRAHFPAKHWLLHSREVSGYRPVQRRTV